MKEHLVNIRSRQASLKRVKVAMKKVISRHPKGGVKILNDLSAWEKGILHQNVLISAL